MLDHARRMVSGRELGKELLRLCGLSHLDRVSSITVSASANDLATVSVEMFVAESGETINRTFEVVETTKEDEQCQPA